MKFRTEIEIPRTRPFSIAHTDRVLLLGSCFTDNIGQRLERDGFPTVHNPMGPLYNPESIRKAVALAKGLVNPCICEDNTADAQKRWHCLDFASRYCSDSLESLSESVTAELKALCASIETADTVIITLGTAYVYRLADGTVVGNCHKFAPNNFTRSILTVDECEQALRWLIGMLPETARIIFTVSPIRHTADGLHGNNVSKATLMLAVDRLVDEQRIYYFPAYEIVCDDLRDYRFYANDMKHPSEQAVEYIYDTFCRYYFSADTLAKAEESRRIYKSNCHRQIIN